MKETKAQALKDAWISETQMFQRIARSGADADSYEDLAKVYDEDMSLQQAQKKKRKLKKSA